MSFARLDVAFPKGAQPIQLLVEQTLLLGFTDRDRRVRRLAEQIDAWPSGELRLLNRGQHLIGRPRRVRLAVGHWRHARRQFGAEPRPENADNEVAVRGLRDLLLEGRAGLVEFLFPAYRPQPDQPGIL